MIDWDTIPKNYMEAVSLLAEWHGGEGGADTICSWDDAQQKTVRFVEIGPDFGDQESIRYIRMGASHELSFSSEAILLSSADWHSVEVGEKLLPDGWDTHALRKVWPYDA